ncbi:hypothetical protein EDB92DRAFT_232426 [Lactarius akahatsu]|uniref:F-box domain-containing protein n=1 Tax=Lactarius akahatsu TaxID=416441 RepID=A0AAD4LL31_9AGAM|nr:hypothetical protein EDB92DRAFT_232426 [Lactarius akahatsu]
MHLYTFPQFWPTLTHVCRRWRQIVLSSPLGLRLRLYCTYGTPVMKTLDCWPPFPLVVNYGWVPMLTPAPLIATPEDEKNVIAALKHSDRVASISLTITNSLLETLSQVVISGPFSALEELVLLSRDNGDNVQFALPNSFRWGPRLRFLHSTRIAIPTLPQLLSPSTGLVDLLLYDIPDIGYFSPYAFADALSEMTQLQTLVLNFLSLSPSRNDFDFPPQSWERVVLPALTCLKYRGTSKYLDRIDAPCLGDINIAFLNQPTLDALQLGLFIGRIEMQASPPQADILSSWGDISITLTQPDSLTRLELQISCGELDLQLSSISQICDHFSPFLSNVEDLNIDAIGLSSVPDDMDDEQWLRIIRAFGGVKDFRVSGELATDILRALRPAGEGHETVLPALRNLHLQEPISTHGPFWDTVRSFLTQRQLSSRPVQLYFSE